MKYQLIDTAVTGGGVQRNVMITGNDTDFTSFPAVVGNPFYDEFLAATKLTDAQIQGAGANVWTSLAI